MKINEIAIINESQEIEEAPIGMLKRLGTGFKGMFSKASANENMVQRSINDLYKKYVEFYTPTNEKKPTAGNMLEFLQATGYPVGNVPNAKYKTLTQLMNAIKKAEAVQKQDPNKKEPVQDKEPGDDNRIPFPNDEKQAAGMYEAKASDPLSKEDVYKIIEFVVRDSWQDDKVKKLEPGNYTKALRDKKQKEKDELEKARNDAQIKALGYVYDPVKDAWVPGKKENTQTAQPSVTEGKFNFDPGDGNLIQLDIAGDVPTPQELEAAIKKHGVANRAKPKSKTTAKKVKDQDPTNKLGAFASGFDDPLGVKGLKDKMGRSWDKAKNAYQDNEPLEKGKGGNTDSTTRSGLNLLKQELGFDNPQFIITGLNKIQKGTVPSKNELAELAPVLQAVRAALDDPQGRNRLRALLKSIR